ncbi:hypothetical protein KKB18_00735 [bacterium]|nr:hypothetical protein [bacterium]
MIGFLMTEDFISSKNIRNYKGQNEIIIKKGMIITPSAKDIAKELGLKVIFEDIRIEKKRRNEGERDTIQGDKIIKQQQSPDMHEERLEDTIERIVKEIFLDKQMHPRKNISDLSPERIILMLNFPEDRETERAMISYISEAGFIIKDLHTYSTSGIRFIISILESRASRDKWENFIFSLGKKFPVNILVS